MRHDPLGFDPTNPASSRPVGTIGGKPLRLKAETTRGVFDHGGAAPTSACRIARIASTSRLTATFGSIS